MILTLAGYKPLTSIEVAQPLMLTRGRTPQMLLLFVILAKPESLYGFLLCLYPSPPATIVRCASSPEPIAPACSSPPAEQRPVPPATASARPSSTSSRPASESSRSSTSTPAPEPSASKPSAAEPRTSGSPKTPPAALASLRANLAALKIAHGYTIEDRGTGALLQRLAKLTTPLDIVFLDPPYEAAAEYESTLGFLGSIRARQFLSPDALVIAEHHPIEIRISRATAP